MDRKVFEQRMKPIRSQIGRNVDWQWQFAALLAEATQDATDNHGIMRKVLTPTTESEFIVRTEDGQGQAYILHGNEGEAKVAPIENAIAPTRMFRIASYPQMRKEDWLMDPDGPWTILDGTANAFWKQEDARLFTLLEAAWKDRVRRETVPLNHDYSTIEARRELHPEKTLYVNTEDHHYEGDARRNLMCPLGRAYLVPEGIGVTKQAFGYLVEPHADVAHFKYGFVVDEMISMAILHPEGIEVFARETVGDLV